MEEPGPKRKRQGVEQETLSNFFEADETEEGKEEGKKGLPPCRPQPVR